LIIKKQDATKVVSENPRGGKGIMNNLRYLGNEEITNNLQGFYLNSLEVGAEIGEHAHIKDEEFYYILEGRGIVKDNGVEKEVGAGDLIYTSSGETHSLENIGDTPIKFIAFIVDK